MHCPSLLFFPFIFLHFLFQFNVKHSNGLHYICRDVSFCSHEQQDKLTTMYYVCCVFLRRADENISNCDGVNKSIFCKNNCLIFLYLNIDVSIALSYFWFYFHFVSDLLQISIKSEWIAKKSNIEWFYFQFETTENLMCIVKPMKWTNSKRTHHTLYCRKFETRKI